MKYTATLALLVAAATASAQPSITSANAMPTAGYGDTILMATGMNVGASGANAMWDFSTMSVTPISTFSVMAPGATPHAATFPSATHALHVSQLGGSNSFYEYYRQSANGWEILASNFTGMSGDNYATNTKLRIPVPFNFNNSKIDTFQKVGGSVDAYTITYDGYGTLKTPGRTLNDVIRIKYQWIGGEIRYEWFTTSPLFYAATWNSNNGGTFNFLGRTAPTGIDGAATDEKAVALFPNPATGMAFVRVSLPIDRNASVVVRDALGRAVLTQLIQGQITPLNISGLAAGMYGWEVQKGGSQAARGRLVIQ